MQQRLIGLVVAPVWMLFFFLYPLQWGNDRKIIEEIELEVTQLPTDRVQKRL